MAKEMKEVKEAEAKKAKKLGDFISAVTNLLIVVGVAAVIYLMYKNPEIFTDYIKNVQKAESEIAVRQEPVQQRTPEYVDAIYAKIELLNSEIAQIGESIARQSAAMVGENQLADLKNKFENLELYSGHMIESKADAKTVLGMMERMDRLEDKVAKIAKVSDRGALVLTATMLVKERAGRGDKFAFEAEILSELAKNDAKIKDAVDTISRLSYEGVPSNREIIAEFSQVYEKMTARAPLPDMTWKERIKYKLEEFIQIKKKTPEEIEADKNLAQLDRIRESVEAYRFARAVEMINDAEINDASSWVKMVENRLAFDRAISKISAYSLAVMKVNIINEN